MNDDGARHSEAEAVALTKGSMSQSDAVCVPRSTLREVLDDGCCPLHLRLRLARALVPTPELDAKLDDETRGGSTGSSVPRRHVHYGMAALDSRCLDSVATHLPLAEVLNIRVCSREQLQWVMEQGAEEHGPRRLVYDRIRARLWMRRVQDLTAGTKDESVFETTMRSFSDEALRQRMEGEMQDALQHMEEQIHRFQAEVDRRLQEQERHVQKMVEERVQKELDSILEWEAVKEMVEKRTRELVFALYQFEVRPKFRNFEARMDSLQAEIEILHDAFAEANLRSKALFWAAHPPVLETAARGAWLGAAVSDSLLYSWRRRLTAACDCQPGPLSSRLKRLDHKALRSELLSGAVRSTRPAGAGVADGLARACPR
eukprot:TRINITY_DN65659_c0_g1_i1.p1 TRINITY_DN65659_c0_g1~~TRINITY_DN65659_c0_g1_i1.p1  ORF type:complete len:373 (+),score=82.09 TRINITY_DN65659_c0_g1_i1:123-1241(+)